jgi:hypothetical protein
MSSKNEKREQDGSNIDTSTYYHVSTKEIAEDTSCRLNFIGSPGQHEYPNLIRGYNDVIDLRALWFKERPLRVATIVIEPLIPRHKTSDGEG